ncbi:MAG: beta-1,4-glucuronosyltransferase WelK [Phenylobacterium sp.]|uniref:beta-1,4-glucuronosyltransferase WelK n=1 Tax=Phenylobacterium sp. TaxID=1871053 RepID=UPI00391D4DF5
MSSHDEASLGSTSRLRICLAGSGGGHVRQLLDLEPAWAPHDHFFITEDTALGRSIGEKHRAHFVAHLALGQARLGSPLKMLGAAVRNFVQTGRVMLSERPDIVITTGAGAVFFSVVWARLTGARVVTIESFARFHRPSVFGRMAAPLAHHKVVQSAALAGVWPDASVFDPLRLLDTPRPPKQSLLFATVGAILPFDRLVEMVAELKAAGEIPERVVIQTGAGGAAPEGIETHETLGFEEIQALLRDADIVVCHGGTGSLITALRQGCRIVAVPRLFAHGEVYDDHQAEITKAFAERGLIGVANTKDELSAALKTARAREPVSATSDPKELIAYLEALISRQTPRRRR